MSIISVNDLCLWYGKQQALKDIHKDIIQFAASEQLTAHANSIAVRFEDEEK